MTSDTHSRLMNMISRVRLREVKTDGNQQDTIVDGLYGEVIGAQSRAMHVQQFGFSSTPPTGAEGVALFIGGHRDQPLILGLESPGHRPKDVPSGGARFYDASGSYVQLNGDGTATIKADKIVVDSPDINLGGEGGKPVATKGTLTSDGAELIDNFSTTVKAV